MRETLILAVLFGLTPRLALAISQAKENVQVKVVVAMTFRSYGLSEGILPATPEQTITNCSGTSGIYRPDYGSQCVTTVKPASPERSVVLPRIGFYNGLKVLLGNGEHLLLLCDAGRSKHCDLPMNVRAGGIKEDCSDEHAAVGTGSNNTHVCIYSATGQPYLGTFEARLEGNSIAFLGHLHT